MKIVQYEHDLGNGKRKKITCYYNNIIKDIFCEISQDNITKKTSQKIYYAKTNKTSTRNKKSHKMPGKDWGKIFKKHNITSKEIRKHIQQNHSTIYKFKLISKYTQNPDLQLQLLNTHILVMPRYIMHKIHSKRVYAYFDFWAAKSFTALKNHLNYYWVHDNIRMAHEINLFSLYPNFPHNPDDLHDFLAKEVSKRSTDLQTIEYNEKENAFFNNIHHIKCITGEYLIYPAMQNHDLIHWGTTLEHCLGSKYYMKEAIKKHNYFLGVYDTKNNLKYNIQLAKKGNILQFCGLKNKSPSLSLNIAVENKIQENLQLLK